MMVLMVLVIDEKLGPPASGDGNRNNAEYCATATGGALGGLKDGGAQWFNHVGNAAHQLGTLPHGGWLGVGASCGAYYFNADSSAERRAGQAEMDYELNVSMAAIAHGGFSSTTPLYMYEDSRAKRLHAGKSADAQEVRPAQPDFAT